MTRLLKPYLFLQRLVIVSHAGKIAYDEKFHHGVNIIRGKNSSGKSTIANFIFYGLGGDFNNWTTEARKCREVFAEVSINKAVLTLKRTVTEHKSQPMSIFWGDYETAIKSNFEGWQHFPYAQSNNKESFSTILFNALDFPEVRSEIDSKITMHQVLRLIYIDQDSPTQNLFRFERFDQPLTRQAISELLLGVYDDSLYQDRLSLRDSQQRYSQKKSQYDALINILNSTGSETDVAKIQQEIEKTRRQLNENQTDIQKTRERKSVIVKANSPLKIESLQKQVAALKSRIIQTDNEIKDIELDIADSKQFIEALQRRVIALDDSILTKTVLGELPLEYCPQCLVPLQNTVDVTHCVLCKQPMEEEIERTYAKRLKQEIELQVKESQKLLDEKSNALLDLSSNRPALIEQYRTMQREIDVEAVEVKTTRDEILDRLLVEQGRLESKIKFLSEQIKAVQQLENLSIALKELKSVIEELDLGIQQKMKEQERKFKNGLAKIEALTLDILKKDLPRQSEFTTAKNVEIDFYKDSFSLDGENNFSASSNFYFKNAVRFAIFYASLETSYFRYPRFIFCDNMEDKGIEQIRTQHLQKVITEISETYQIGHQIIFTTSMIEPTLDNSKYCIGRKYDEKNKSLLV
ncbi:MAG TPA: AAA family ATPase [Pyrinomonadaceae bacterium]|jgi:hypothetical protein